jgi:hypothetical protein
MTNIRIYAHNFKYTFKNITINTGTEAANKICINYNKVNASWHILLYWVQA